MKFFNICLVSGFSAAGGWRSILILSLDATTFQLESCFLARGQVIFFNIFLKCVSKNCVLLQHYLKVEKFLHNSRAGNRAEPHKGTHCTSYAFTLENQTLKRVIMTKKHPTTY